MSCRLDGHDPDRIDYETRQEEVKPLQPQLLAVPAMTTSRGRATEPSQRWTACTNDVKVWAISFLRYRRFPCGSSWFRRASSGLPKEVSTEQAAKILGVSKDTVLKLKAEGILEYRNTAPPGSSRPVYAFALDSVLEVRTSYDRDEPPPRQPPEPRCRRVRGRRGLKHLDLGD
jgi:hypothetical protein